MSRTMSGREVFDNVVGLLDASQVSFQIIEHPAFTDSEEAARYAGVRPAQAAKSLLLRSLGTYMLAVLPADRRLDSKKLKKVIGSGRLSFATPEEMIGLTGCEPGTCHPFGNLIDIASYTDPRLAANDTIACNAGLRTHTILFPYTDYVQVAGPVTAEIT